MANKKYLSIDLDDARIKDLADVISNKTSKRIINYLADKEASESEISRDLKLPANTVNYNVAKLLKSGLVEKSKTYFWSVKGKKIPYYSVANKKIVISPKSRSKVVNGFLALAISGVLALGIKVYTEPSLEQTANVESVGKIAEDMAFAEAGSASEVVTGVVSNVPEVWVWFLIGAVVSLGIYFLVGKVGQK